MILEALRGIALPALSAVSIRRIMGICGWESWDSVWYFMI